MAEFQLKLIDPKNMTSEDYEQRIATIMAEHHRWQTWEWSSFFVLVGVVAIVAALGTVLGLLALTDRNTKIQRELTERTRIEQCSTLTDEAIRTLCINGINGSQ